MMMGTGSVDASGGAGVRCKPCFMYRFSHASCIAAVISILLTVANKMPARRAVEPLAVGVAELAVSCFLLWRNHLR